MTVSHMTVGGWGGLTGPVRGVTRYCQEGGEDKEKRWEVRKVTVGTENNNINTDSRYRF